MTNFLEFINEDIEIKKTLISTMPANTKVNRRKYNEKIESISEKYLNYRNSVKDYITVKSKSFVSKTENKDIEKIKKEIEELKEISFLLNPSNGFFQKMEFDKLFYKLKNYSSYDFSFLYDILNEFIDKFETVGIVLSDKDFNYTYYVNEYMRVFLETKASKTGDYKPVSDAFEKIYWVNPDIIKHVELNFRKLVRKNEKKFINYINYMKSKVVDKKHIGSYQDCLKKMEENYLKLQEVDGETIEEIIEKAKTGTINIVNYFENEKSRTQAFEDFMIKKVDLSDKEVLNQFYKDMKKLKISIDEYSNFNKFHPIIEDFKKKYENQIGESHRSELKNIISQINKKEVKLDKLNRKAFGFGKGLVDYENNKKLKQLKIDSIKMANELYDLYEQCDTEYFNDKVLSIISKSFVVSELLHLYYSYDYFKKTVIKEVFEVDTYEDIAEYSKEFDDFALNPLNLITKSVQVFEEKDLAEIIVNKYRLSNIDINKEGLDPEDIKDRIKYLLRIQKIDGSPITFEQIWFIVEVTRLVK